MITVKNGNATVSRVGLVPVPDAKFREDAMGQPPAPHNIEKLGNALGVRRLEAALEQVLGRDNDWTRCRRGEAYQRVFETAVGQLSKPIDEARRIAANQDLKDEIRAQRVAETIAAAWPKAEAELAKAADAVGEVVDFSERVLAEAWTLPDDTDHHLEELRSREVRDALRGMDEQQRVGAVLRAAQAGQLDLFRRLEADPLAALPASLPAEVLPRAKAMALESAGLGWVGDMVADAHADAEHINALVATFRTVLEGEFCTRETPNLSDNK